MRYEPAALRTTILKCQQASIIPLNYSMKFLAATLIFGLVDIPRRYACEKDTKTIFKLRGKHASSSNVLWPEYRRALP